MSEPKRPWERPARVVRGWATRAVPLLATLLLLGGVRPARAQLGPPDLPPVPPLPGAPLPKPLPPPPPRVEGTVQFSFVATSGNASTQSIGLGGESFYRPGAWTLQEKVAFVRQESEGDLKAKSFTGLFRAARERTRRVALYGQYDFLRDLFAGIEQRHTVTGGVALKVADAARQKLTLQAGLGVASERRIEDGSPDPFTAPVREIDTRATATQTVQYVLQISTTSQATNDFRLAEALGTPGDWRFENDAALSSKINSVFSLKVSNTLRFVHDPVPGFMQTDTVTSIALVAKF